MQTVPIRAGGAIPWPVLFVLALSVYLLGAAGGASRPGAGRVPATQSRQGVLLRLWVRWSKDRQRYHVPPRGADGSASLATARHQGAGDELEQRAFRPRDHHGSRTLRTRPQHRSLARRSPRARHDAARSHLRSDSTLVTSGKPEHAGDWGSRCARVCSRFGDTWHLPRAWESVPRITAVRRRGGSRGALRFPKPGS